MKDVLKTFKITVSCVLSAATVFLLVSCGKAANNNSKITHESRATSENTVTSVDSQTVSAVTEEPSEIEAAESSSSSENSSESKTVTKPKVTSSQKPIQSTPQKTEVKYTPEGGSFGWDASDIDNQPYLVAVNRALCTLTVYKKDGNGNYTVPIKAMACSVGRSGHSTPTGRFNTSTRYEWRLMVDSSYGRYAIRIKGQIMFHSVCYESKDKTKLEYEEYNKLGSPASLGCIRLCVRDIKWLYDNCPNAFPVVIYDDTSLSGPLGKPDSVKIDVNDVEKRGWDPTDWDEQSPWNRKQDVEETVVDGFDG